MHVIAAKAQAFGEALDPSFRTYQEQVVANAKAFATGLTNHGFRLCSGGTDNHLLLVDLRNRDAELTGAEVESWLGEAGIVVNKNGIPNDPRPPMITSGLRFGTPATTTRGLREDEMQQVADWIERVVASGGSEASTIREEVRTLCTQFPLPH